MSGNKLIDRFVARNKKMTTFLPGSMTDEIIIDEETTSQSNAINHLFLQAFLAGLQFFVLIFIAA